MSKLKFSIQELDELLNFEFSYFQYYTPASGVCFYISNDIIVTLEPSDYFGGSVLKVLLLNNKNWKTHIKITRRNEYNYYFRIGNQKTDIEDYVNNVEIKIIHFFKNEDIREQIFRLPKFLIKILFDDYIELPYDVPIKSARNISC